MRRLLILLTLPQEVRDFYAARLRQRFPQLQIDVVDHFSKAAPFMPETEILVTFGPMLRDEVFASSGKLKWIQALGTGVDNIVDLPSLGKEVLVTNVRGIHGAPVSEATIAFMLSLARDMPRSVRAQEQSKWERWPSALLAGKTVGIFGVGLIAEYLAPICKTFGMTVVGISGSPRETKHFDRVAHRNDLTKVAGDLDFLVVLTPLTPETRNIVGAKVFAAMKPTAYLVNVARGGVVDEPALIAALEAEKIAGAGLDVFSQEPLPSDNPLWKTKNLTIFSHLGGYSQGYEDRAMPTIAGNMGKFLAGDLKSMINIVRKPASWKD